MLQGLEDRNPSLTFYDLTTRRWETDTIMKIIKQSQGALDFTAQKITSLALAEVTALQSQVRAESL